MEHNIKGIYFCVEDNLDDDSNGIIKKINNQITVFKQHFKIEIINIKKQQTLFEKIKFILPIIKSKREKSFESIFNNYELNEYSFVYIRRPSMCKSFLKMLINIKNKNPNIKLILELPTYPFHQEYRGLDKLLIFKSSCIEKKLSSVIDRIVTYSDDDIIWGIDTLKISNSVDFNKVKPRKYINDSNHEINLIVVATFSYWHGVDRLLMGKKEYKGRYNFKIHLVGDGPELKKLKNLVDKYKLSDVYFYGRKSGKELDDIYNQCDIAVDALGRHRSLVYYNSSLKGKEYGAKGLPIVSGVKTELDLLDFEYYLRVPADDTAIDFQKIENFYNKVYLDKKESEIISKIVSFNYQHFSFEHTFNKIIEYIKKY